MFIVTQKSKPETFCRDYDI